MKKGIVGAGGFGREVYWSLSEEDRTNCVFFVDEQNSGSPRCIS